VRRSKHCGWPNLRESLPCARKRAAVVLADREGTRAAYSVYLSRAGLRPRVDTDLLSQPLPTSIAFAKRSDAGIHQRSGFPIVDELAVRQRSFERVRASVVSHINIRLHSDANPARWRAR